MAESSAPNPAETSTAPPAPSRSFIRLGDNVLLKLPSGILKPVKITANGTISLGKYGSFKGNLLVNHPYGHTYEIDSNTNLIHPIQVTLNDVEETEANNQLIASTGAQALSHEDIQALKDSGLTGREIIQRQIDEHKAFELKTEYSKDKYLKRKQAKYLQLFTPLEPTVHQIAQFNFERQPSKTRELRPDTLANLLAMANVRPNSRLLVVEDLGGMVVAAAVERMAGRGRIMVINDADSPPDLHLLESFNFSPEDLAPISSLHWAATQESWSPPDLPLGTTADPEEALSNATATATATEEAGKVDADVKVEEGGVAPATTAEEGSTAAKAAETAPRPPVPRRNNRETLKLKKRRATFEKAREAREDFFRGEFDGVIIACEYEPFSIIERLLPRIAGSAPVVVFSHHIQVLFPALQALKSHSSFVAPTIHEPFLRRYQVLPGRCHPEMQGMASGGMILSCIRVLENDDAQAISMARRGKKRPAAPAEAEASKAASAATSADEAAAAPEKKRVKVEEVKKEEEEGSSEGAAGASASVEDAAMQVDATSTKA
ncbi:hypothetical protein JCM10908_005479 [Rhodotorula pacifica]|uniref:tRNA 1-methyladenosine methyltransferase subunit GCD10 n=1 Tax=Rhodotorula pacifica TaxID=1495444 RepID=UPI00316DFD6B